MEMQQQDVSNRTNGNVVENGNVSAEDTFVDDLIDFSKAVEYGVCSSETEEEMVPFHLESINVTHNHSFPLPLNVCLPVIISKLVYAPARMKLYIFNSIISYALI